VIYFFEFLSLYFLISNLFLTIVIALDVPKEEVQVLFGHHKQHSPPLESGLPPAFKCSVTNWSTLWMIANCATSQFWKKILGD
jgi:hypothetical protein